MTDPTADAAKLLPCPLSDDQIRHMVDRFLGWCLPKPWHPDNGVTYMRPNYIHPPADHDWPTGTNLFDWSQTEAMVRYMAEGLPTENTRPQPAPPEGDCPDCEGRGWNVGTRPVCCGNVYDSGECRGDCAVPEQFQEQCATCGGFGKLRTAPPAGEPDYAAWAARDFDAAFGVAELAQAYEHVYRLGLAARPKVEDADTENFGPGSWRRLLAQLRTVEADLRTKETQLAQARADLKLLREYASLPAWIAKRQGAGGDGLERLWTLLDQWDARDADLSGAEYEGHQSRQKVAKEML